MKKLIFLLLIALAIPCVCFAGSTNHVNITFVESGTPPSTADFQWDLDDDAASTAIIATVGSNGSLVNVNTDTVATTTGCLEGSGCFDMALAANDTVRPSLPIPLTAYNDGTITIQAAIYVASTETVPPNTRLIQSSTTVTTLLATFPTATTMTVYFGGTNLGTMSISDIESDSWNVFRLVFDTGHASTLRIYQGATEETLSLADSSAIALGTVYGATSNFEFYGTSSASTNLCSANAKTDQVKVWNDVVTP